MRRRGRVNPLYLIAGLLVMVPLVWVLASGFGKDPRAVPSVLEGKPAPSFALQSLEGEQRSLSDYAGQPVVINFWSTWCQPCKIEHPLLLQAPRAFPDVAWLGVIYADDADNARRYLKRSGSAYPHLVDPEGRAALDYGVAGVPETYFIDSQGTIVHKHVGPLDTPTLRALVERAREGV